MSNPIAEKLLELITEAKEKGDLKIEAIPIRDEIKEDVICIPLSDYETFIRDQTSLELLLLLYKDFNSYDFDKIIKAVNVVRVTTLSEIRIPQQENKDE